MNKKGAARPWPWPRWSRQVLGRDPRTRRRNVRLAALLVTLCLSVLLGAVALLVRRSSSSSSGDGDGVLSMMASWGRSSSSSSSSSSGRPRHARGRRTAYLHVGPHKTASTYIQDRMCRNAAKLEKAGVVVPIAKACPPKKCAGGKYFADVVNDLRGRLAGSEPHRPVCSTDAPWEEFQATLREIAATQPAASILLSAEALDSMTPEAVAELGRVLREEGRFDDVQVIATYRSKLEQALSIYTQWNKRIISPMTLTDFVFQHLADTSPPLDDATTTTTTTTATTGAAATATATAASAAEANWSVSGRKDLSAQLGFDRLLRTYAAEFGLESIHVFSYSGLRAAGQDPWEALVEEVLGLTLGKTEGEVDGEDEEQEQNEAAPADNNEKINASPDPLEVSAFAALRRVVAAWMMAGALPVPQAGHGTENANRVACGARILWEAWKERLPVQCSSMRGIVSLWERQERETLASVRGRARLYYFKEDGEGRLDWANATSAHEACDVDVGGWLGDAQGLKAPLVRDGVALVKEQCFPAEGKTERKNGGSFLDSERVRIRSE